jgi:hypothetical protein
MLEFWRTNASQINTVVALLLFAGSAWVYLKIFHPLSKRIDSAEATGKLLAVSIEHNATVTQLAVNSLRDALDGMKNIAKTLGEEHIKLAVEQGRQAERIHYLTTQETATQLRVDQIVRRNSRRDGENT